ncbi:MAG: EAL domain-containing protein [Rhodospirillales bacterium]|nr:EAL domain-containing protein [Rhodospirillales bacterium]
MRASPSTVFRHPSAAGSDAAHLALFTSQRDPSGSWVIGSGLARLTTVIATIAALVVATVLPLAYFHFGQQFEAGQIEAETKQEASLVSSLISHNPANWQTEITRLLAILNSFPGPEAYTHTIYDAKGSVVVQLGHHSKNAPWPLALELVEARRIYQADRVVAQVEIRRPLDDLLTRTAFVAAIASLLALLLFVALRVMPLRALQRAVQDASFLASHDAMTGLPNRTLFQDRLRQALAQSRRLGGETAVLCVDLDRFKDVNDTLGHAAGDQLLRRVTGRLRTCLRETDTLARLGGDEFAIIQSGPAQPEAAAVVAQRIVERLAEPFDLNGHEAIIGCSVGIALSTGMPSDNPEAVLRSADLALYRAKEEGRGTFCFFEEEMNIRLNARKRLETDLRRALAEEQFQLHYQPQIDLASGRLVGVEALLRWYHPERGPILPGDFIPVAEDTGLIGPLGEWVLQTACRQATRWPGLKMAVNLSPVQFRMPGLELSVARVLAETGMLGERLELEITESVLLHDTEATITTLRALKNLGVSVAMDDFGTGYSSLGYLRRFPFDKIKIDRSFVCDVAEGGDATAIVRAVVRLGRSLGIRTNAEGVETGPQAEFLAVEGCDEVQGYHFGRPMMAADIEQMIRAAPIAGEFNTSQRRVTQG